MQKIFEEPDRSPDSDPAMLGTAGIGARSQRKLAPQAAAQSGSGRSCTDGALPGELVELLERELRAVAARSMAHEGPGHTLQPTAIVSELWLRVVHRDDLRFASKEKFLAYASDAVRHILVDHARRRLATRRGGAWQRVELDSERASVAIATAQRAECDDAWAISVVELDDELRQLESECERSARVFTLRHFGGMSDSQIAGLLGVSDRTVREIWRSARAWMASRIDAQRTS